MLRVTFVILIIFICLCPSAFAETIKLKSGRVVNAAIIDRGPDYIKVDFNGVILTYYKDEIESIGFETVQVLTKKQPDQSERFSSQDRIDNLIEKISHSVVVIEGKKAKNNVEGTGFFISEDGLVVTNFHVVFKTTSIQIRTKDGATYPVEFIVNSNENLDLCLLKVNISGAPALVLGDSDLLKTGQIIFTMGHREGSRYQSSSGPYIGKEMIDGEENLRTKMVTGHGNSGGPILNQEGKIVGISKAFSKENGQNFGIPINIAKPFLVYNNPMTVASFNAQFSPADELTYNGQGLLLGGKYGEAINNFKQAISLAPRQLRARIGAAKTYRLMAMESEALSAWEEVTKLDPNNIQAHIGMGKIYLNRNQIDAAIVHLQKAADLAPQTKEIYNDLGFAYGQKGMTKETIKTYKKAIELNPQDGASHFNLAVAYFNKRDFTTAENYAQQAQNFGYVVPATFLSQLKEAHQYNNIFELQ